MTPSPAKGKASELEQLIRVVGAHVIDTATLLHPDDLPKVDVTTFAGVAEVVHVLLWRVGFEAGFTLVDGREQSRAWEGASFSYGEVEDSGNVALTIVNLATPELTLDDLVATIAELRIEVLYPPDETALDEVDVSAFATYFGFGLLVVPMPENPLADLTRDAWLDQLALWHALHGDAPDASLDAATRAALAGRIAALPERTKLRESLGMPAQMPPPSPRKPVPPLDEATRAAARAIDAAPRPVAKSTPVAKPDEPSFMDAHRAEVAAQRKTLAPYFLVVCALLATLLRPSLQHYGVSASNSLVYALGFVAAGVIIGSRVERRS